MSIEDILCAWSKGPSKTEQEKRDNAENAVRKAIMSHRKLADMDISVFTQGSYKNRTNVKQDSDVDICVCLNSTFFANYPKGMTREDFGDTEGSIKFYEFKNLIGEALTNYFGYDSVKRGNKAFDVHANTYMPSVITSLTLLSGTSCVTTSLTLCIKTILLAKQFHG